MSHSYRDLIAWQKAKRLAVITYGVTERFPRSETFGLTSQLRRCAVSIASNIAEGQGRNTKGEFIQSLGHARGSLLELQTQSEIAFDLKYVSEADYRALDKLMGMSRSTQPPHGIDRKATRSGRPSPSSNVKREISKRETLE